MEIIELIMTSIEAQKKNLLMGEVKWVYLSKARP
jgi:hypothetical protein